MDEEQDKLEFPEMPLFGAPESPFAQGDRNVSEDPETLERFASHWKWNTSDDVILNNFPEAQVRTESSGEVKLYELNTHTAYLYPKWHGERFHEGVRFYGVIRLVISTDGAKLLKAHKEELESKSIAREDITLYLEDNTGDILSDAVMLINAGDIAQQRLYDGTGVYNFVNSKHSLTREQFKELLSYTKDSGLLTSFVAHVVSGLYAVISFVPDKVAELLDYVTGFISDKARIEESVWNPKKRKHAEDYGEVLSAIESRLGLVNEKVSMLTSHKSEIVPEAMKAPLRSLQGILDSFHSFSRSLADSIQDTAELFIAFVCGVWNALIDLLNGLLTLCSLLLKAPGAIGDVADGYDEFSYFYQLFKEYMDNFIQSVAAIDWSEVFSEMVTGFKDIVLSIPEKLQKLSAAEVGYYSGYVVFNIAEFFFPILKIAKLAKAGKLAEGFAEMVVDMQKVAQKMASAGRKVGKAVTQAPKKAYDFLFDMLDNLANLLRQGTATVKELVQKMFERIRAWLDDVIGMVKIQVFLLGKSSEMYMTLPGLPQLRRLFANNQLRLIMYSKLRLGLDGQTWILMSDDVVLKTGTRQEMTLFLKELGKLSRKELDDELRALYNLAKYGIRRFRFSARFDAHTLYGHIRIRVKSSKTNQIIDEYEYSPVLSQGISPAPRKSYGVKVTGAHSLKLLDNKFVQIIEDYGTFTLKSGENVRVARIQFWVEELKWWVTKGEPSTFWPKNWSISKIKSIVEEATENLIKSKGRVFRGKTREGVTVEFWINETTKEIESAYLILN